MFDISFGSLGALDWAINALVLAATVVALLAFARPALRRSTRWRATVTPLASIIGSGFLVVAPLLGLTAGRFALLAMAAILVLAYLVGNAVRYNIAHVEEICEAPGTPAASTASSTGWGASPRWRCPPPTSSR